MKKLTIFFLCIFLLIACKKEPSANFSYQGTLIVGQVIQFQNLSANADSYSWDFGDGTISTMISPQYTYSKPGRYTVTLTVEGNGKSATINKSLVIGGTTYSFKNETGIILYGFCSFFYNGGHYDNFVEHGILNTGATTSIVIANSNEISFACKLQADGGYFISADQYYLTIGSHNDLVVNEDTQVYQVSKSGSVNNRDTNRLTIKELISR